MRRPTAWSLPAIVFVATLALAATSATAQSDNPFEKCLNDPNRPPNAFEFGPPSCTFDENGNVISRQYPEDVGTGISGAVGLFIMLGILWAAVPLFIAVRMARDRGDRPGIAVLYTLAGGWLGLALYHASTRQRPPEPTPTAPPTRAIAERLIAIDELLAQGMITTEEHAGRRAAILAET